MKLNKQRTTLALVLLLALAVIGAAVRLQRHPGTAQPDTKGKTAEVMPSSTPTPVPAAPRPPAELSAEDKAALESIIHQKEGGGVTESAGPRRHWRFDVPSRDILGGEALTIFPHGPHKPPTKGGIWDPDHGRGLKRSNHGDRSAKK